jgi:hypothetical protein
LLLVLLLQSFLPFVLAYLALRVCFPRCIHVGFFGRVLGEKNTVIELDHREKREEEDRRRLADHGIGW